MTSRRINDIKFLYDRDDGQQQLHAQRQYIDPVSNTLLTPITGLFAARVIPTDTKVENPKTLTKRRVLAYINNLNVSTGVSEMIAYLPYKPGDIKLVAHLREILSLTRVICADYLGEIKSAF